MTSIISARKKYKLVHDERMGSPTTTRGPINCSMCALCREQSDKTLICPAKSKRRTSGLGMIRGLSVGNEPFTCSMKAMVFLTR